MAQHVLKAVCLVFRLGPTAVGKDLVMAVSAKLCWTRFAEKSLDPIEVQVKVAYRTNNAV